MYKPRVQHVLGMANDMTDDFNCWGATMFIADPTVPTLGWVDYEGMHEWITTKLEPIERKQAKEGDIVALFARDEKAETMRLIHTAYCVEPNRYVHKLGQNVARLETLNKVLKSYAREANGFVFLRVTQRSKSCV